MLKAAEVGAGEKEAPGPPARTDSSESNYFPNTFKKKCLKVNPKMQGPTCQNPTPTLTLKSGAHLQSCRPFLPKPNQIKPRPTCQNPTSTLTLKFEGHLQSGHPFRGSAPVVVVGFLLNFQSFLLRPLRCCCSPERSGEKIE